MKYPFNFKIEKLMELLTGKTIEEFILIFQIQNHL